MARIRQVEPRRDHVRTALEAAGMTMPQLISKYPYQTPQGYTRASNNGTQYRRIGERILSLDESRQAIVKRLEPVLFIDKLRNLGVKRLTLQEANSLVDKWDVELSSALDEYETEQKASGHVEYSTQG